MKNLNDVFNSVDEAIKNAKESGNFDEVINKTKAYAKKSAEAIEISRKRIELLDAKTKLSKAYEKYGKLQFSVYDGQDINQDELDSTVDEIVMLKSQSEFLEEEIEAFKAEIAASVEMKMGRKTDDVEASNVEVVNVDSDAE